MNRLTLPRFSRLIALLGALPAIASAHPGHENDLTWDFGSGLGHVHYGQVLLVGLLVVGVGVGIAKLAARFFKN